MKRIPLLTRIRLQILVLFLFARAGIRLGMRLGQWDLRWGDSANLAFSMEIKLLASDRRVEIEV